MSSQGLAAGGFLKYRWVPGYPHDTHSNLCTNVEIPAKTTLDSRSVFIGKTEGKRLEISACGP